MVVDDVVVVPPRGTGALVGPAGPTVVEVGATNAPTSSDGRLPRSARAAPATTARTSAAMLTSTVTRNHIGAER